MVAPEPADLALDAALLVCALDPRSRERRREQVVGAQRDEAVALDPTSALQDLLHRRGQVVVADLREHAAEPVERLDVQLEERLLRLDQRGLTERRPRERRAHKEQMNRRAHPRQVDLRLAPVDLRTHTRVVHLRHEHLPDRPAHRALPSTHVLPHRRLRDLGAVLVDQPPPDPPRGVTLLPRRHPIGLKPRVDQRPIRPQPRRRPTHRRTLRRRQRRSQRLPHRPPMNPIPLRQRPDRQPLPIAIPPDLLELLHPRPHPHWRLPLELDEPRTLGRRSDGGGASSSHHSGATSNHRAESPAGTSTPRRVALASTRDNGACG